MLGGKRNRREMLECRGPGPCSVTDLCMALGRGRPLASLSCHRPSQSRDNSVTLTARTRRRITTSKRGRQSRHLKIKNEKLRVQRWRLIPPSARPGGGLKPRFFGADGTASAGMVACVGPSPDGSETPGLGFPQAAQGRLSATCQLQQHQNIPNKTARRFPCAPGRKRKRRNRDF